MFLFILGRIDYVVKGDESDSLRIPCIYVDIDSINDKTGQIETQTMLCNYQELNDLLAKTKDALKQAQVQAQTTVD